MCRRMVGGQRLRYSYVQENGGWSEAQLCAGEWWVVRGSGTVMCRRMVGGQRLSYVQENGGWSEAQVQLCAGEWWVVRGSGTVMCRRMVGGCSRKGGGYAA